MRIIGFDDIQYANLLPVPLTTIHQPCHDMGIATAAAMLERSPRPTYPPAKCFQTAGWWCAIPAGACIRNRSMLPISDGLTAIFG